MTGMGLKTLTNISRGPCRNVFYSRTRRQHSSLFYVVESADWSVRWDGEYITGNLNIQKLLNARTTTTHTGIHHQIIHFGSRGTFLPDTWRRVNPSNRIIFTWFHGTEEDKTPQNLAAIAQLPEASKKADIIHTSCEISRKDLIKWGVSPDKITVVPLGVDLDIFKPFSKTQKAAIRKELGLPGDRIVIGSFQKDGIGWGEGREPKLEKGPDIFIRAIAELSKNYDIFVLLTGPARGYVKTELERIDVPYKHFFLKDYREIPKYYAALDLYLVTSRAEGGPKAILESMAMGVPFVATDVGGTVDICNEEQKKYIFPVGDMENFSKGVIEIIESPEMSKLLQEKGLINVKRFSADRVCELFIDQIWNKESG